VLYILSHLIFLGALLLLFAATGFLAERCRPGGAEPPVPRLVVRIGLGAAAWIAALFAMAATGLLRAALIHALGGAVLLTAGILVWRERRAARSEVPEETELPGTPPPPDRPGALARAILAVALGIVGAGLLRQALRPGVFWDAGAHRLLIPKLWVEAGGFRSIPMSVYSNWPLNTELLFALAMIVQDHVLAKLVHFSCGALLVAAVAGLARRSGAPGAGLLAATLLLLNEVVRFEIHIAYVDVAFALFFFLAFAYFVRGLDEEGRDARRSFLLAGIFCGVVAGTKLFGFFTAVALAALLLVERLRPGVRRGAVLGPLALLLVPTFALLAPWLVKSALATGNPVYPFLWGVFGGPDWNAELGERYLAWNRSIGMGRSPVDFLLLPVRVILEGGPGYAHFDGRIHPAWIVLVPLSIGAAFRDALVRRCLVTTLVYFALWSVSSQQMRFLIPVLPLLAVAAAVSIARLVGAVPQPAGRGAARVLAAAGAGGLLLFAARGDLRAGSRLAAEYVRVGDRIVAGAVHPVYRYVNETLPPGAKLLLLNTNQGFFLEREYLADSFFEASQLDAWLSTARTEDQIRELLRERGITHVLFEHHDWGIPYSPVLISFLEDPAFARPIYRSPEGRFTVLELR